MTSVSEPKIQRLALEEIEANRAGRLRPVSEAGVESLMASIDALGVIKDPIHVRRKGRGDRARLILMAGGHRLEAARRLGWTTIPARVWADVSDAFARLVEIDDNLAGADLSALELAVFLAERKRVYETLHPETKAGTAGALARHGAATEIISFADSVAEKRDLSPRHIRNFVAIGARLSAREVAALSGMEAPVKLKDLMALARIGEAGMRSEVVGLFASGAAGSVGEALAQLKPDLAKKPPAAADEAALRRLLTAWRRAPMRARRRFAEECHGEIAALLTGRPDLRAI